MKFKFPVSSPLFCLHVLYVFQIICYLTYFNSSVAPSRCLAGYGIDQSLIRSWLDHQGIDNSQLDNLDAMTYFVDMIWPAFIESGDVKSIAPLELSNKKDVLVLVRYIGTGSRYMREKDEDQKVKQALVAHSGLKDEEFTWHAFASY